MVGILLLVLVLGWGAWFWWLYFSSPRSDIERIKADQGGTGVTVLNVERDGTKHARAMLTWVAGNPTYFTGGGWYRIYDVTTEMPDGMTESYSVAVEARLFGLSEIKRIDRRSDPGG